VKFVACAKCGLSDVAVRDDFDEDEEMAVCEECDEQMLREIEDGRS
jgi:hypothetical protein